jgi:hypothetical protein
MKMLKNKKVSGWLNSLRYGEKVYNPRITENPNVSLPPGKNSAWLGLERIVKDIIVRFDIEPNSCLEFGVEYGYSTAVLASYFKFVTGVDTFEGDVHSSKRGNFMIETSSYLSRYPNVTLVQSDYRDFLKKNETSLFDLIHVDIVHTFEDTYACGLWSAQRSKCTLFHDTESFPSVKKAVSKIAKETGKKFYNFKGSNGLGIVV